MGIYIKIKYTEAKLHIAGRPHGSKKCIGSKTDCVAYYVGKV